MARISCRVPDTHAESGLGSDSWYRHEVRCHNQAQHAFFDYLTANGFQALNGALSAAVKAVLLVVGEEHPSFNPQEPTAHTKAWLAEEEAPQ